jgi:hypothetical protein
MSNERLLIEATTELRLQTPKYNWPILATDWQQRWNRELNGRYWHDQYGFRIDEHPDQDKPYTLSHHGVEIAKVYRKITAKVISCILMNDILQHKGRPRREEL